MEPDMTRKKWPDQQGRNNFRTKTLLQDKQLKLLNENKTFS
jgi:hypothetical protein